MALVVAAVAGGFLLYGRVSDPFRTLTPLPVADYLENANSLRGNAYKLDATVAKGLGWTKTSGRLFSVETAAGEMLPVHVPPEFDRANIERGQRLFFKVEVGDKGILAVLDVKKA